MSEKIRHPEEDLFIVLKKISLTEKLLPIR